MAAVMQLVHCNTVKENHFSTNKYCHFGNKGLLGTSPPEMAAAKMPVCHDAVEEDQFGVRSKQQFPLHPHLL